MSGEPFSLGKFLSGLIPFQGEKLGKLLYTAIIALLCAWILWAAFLRRTISAPNTVERGAAQANCNCTAAAPAPKLPVVKLGPVSLW